MDLRIGDSWDLMALPLVPTLVGTGGCWVLVVWWVLGVDGSGIWLVGAGWIGAAAGWAGWKLWLAWWTLRWVLGARVGAASLVEAELGAAWWCVEVLRQR